MAAKRFLMILGAVCTLFLASTPALAGHGSQPASALHADGQMVHVSGIIVDNHNEPIDEAEVSIVVNGKELDHVVTGRNGKYVARVSLGNLDVPSATFEIEARKASFKAETVKLVGTELTHGSSQFYISEDLTLSRVLGPAFWISAIIFVLAYVMIAFELLHRTVAAMFGAALMLIVSYTVGTLNPAYRIFSFEKAIASIDMNVIFLLMGMMIIVGILKHTGVFQWCAYVSYRLARGKVFLLTAILMVFTAVTSAFLDNVTTMLLLTGVAIEITVSLSLNPLVMLIPLVLASNVGGTATLIGDPPNIMIGSFAHLNFMQFVIALGSICLAATVGLILYSKFVWGKTYNAAKVENVKEYIGVLKERYRITDSHLLSYGMAILAFVVFLFITNGYWHLEVSIAALMGASLLLTVAVLTEKVDLLEVIEKDIEWPTLMFFLFLFMIVGAVESSGLLALIADGIMKLSEGNFVAACSLILWVSAIVSAFVDNIPFTATMLPIVAYLSTAIPSAGHTLWWALAAGACFGGNGTLIGASANVVTMGIAESRGYRISFIGFMKTAFPYMVISVLIAHAWLLIFRP